MVVNHHPNVVRSEYARLKTVLLDCGRHTPQSQNRKDHPDFRDYLRGRMAWVAL